MQEISDQIMTVTHATKPLHVTFLAGSVHGNLEGNLRVVQSGLASFLKSIQTKRIEKLVISTGKQKGQYKGQPCQWAAGRNIL